MANIKKKIKFHPLDTETGDIIKTEDLYPETSLDNVVDINTGKKLDTIIDEIKEEIVTKAVQPDWKQETSSASDYIKNKPRKLSDFQNNIVSEAGITGDYNKLINKPDINDGKTTVQQNGTTIGEIYANQANANTINITVPTKTSDLTNDGGADPSKGVYQTRKDVETFVNTKSIAGISLASNTETIKNYKYSTLNNDTTYDIKETGININPWPSAIDAKNLILRNGNLVAPVEIKWSVYPNNSEICIQYTSNELDIYYSNVDGYWKDINGVRLPEGTNLSVDLYQTGNIYNETYFRALITDESASQGTTSVEDKICGALEKLPDLYANKADTYTKAVVNNIRDILQNNINTEASRAKGVENNLDAKIGQEITDRIADVNAEETRAKAAEQGLAGDISTETSRATNKENELNTKIETEISNRALAVSAEENRAKGIEQGLAGDISAEVTRAQNRETELQTAINNKANTNYVDTELAKKQAVIDDNNLLDYTLVSGLGTAATKNAGNNAGEVPTLNNEGKLDASIIPFQEVTGQMVYGGTATIVDETTTATLSTHAKHKLELPDSTTTLVLLPDIAEDPTKGGYKDNEGIYYIVDNEGDFAGSHYGSGDWILSTGDAWTKVATTSSVKDIKVNNTSVLDGSGNAIIAASNAQAEYNASTNKLATMADVNIKANQNTTYTKTETDTLLNTKADAADLADYETKSDLTRDYYDKSVLYTKTEINTTLTDYETKADLTENYYNKTTIDSTLSNYETKAELETTLGDYIQKSSTAGLVKNDGTIDTNTYLTQHQDISGKVDKEIESINGTAKILNEADGGGAMFESTTLKSYVGVHDGTGPTSPDGAGLAGQIYAKNKTSNDIAKINLYSDGFYYTKNTATGSETADDEIATKGDIAVKGIQKNGTDLTPDANGKVNITVPTVDYPVTDVQVDGQSVMDGKVAKIHIPAAQVQADWNQANPEAIDYIKNKPTIPAEVTETTVANWGFTKNQGTYIKPNTGIPKSDLNSSVQASLDLADGALQDNDFDRRLGSVVRTVNSIAPDEYGNVDVGGGGGGGGDVPSTRKVAGISLAQDTYDVKEYRYEDSVETIEVAATEDDLVNGNAYSVRSSYDLDEFNVIFDLISGNANIYEDETNNVIIGFYKGSDYKEIYIMPVDSESENYYYYDYDTENEQWWDWSEEGNDHPCETLPSVTIDKSKIITGAPIKLGDLLAQIFIAPHQETIEKHQSLQEKIEDLPNWEYNKKPIYKTIPGLQDDMSCKINFDASTYTDILNPALNNSSYSSGDNQPGIYYYNGCTYYGLNIGAYDDPVNYEGYNNYYLQYDLSNPEKVLVWRKGSNSSYEEYTQEELNKLTITLHTNGINSNYDAQAADTFLKTILVNTDDTPITTLVDGTSYKFNTNALSYRNIFDTIYENFGNSGTFYNWTASDSNINYISVYSYYYNNTPYIDYTVDGNSNYFYLIPSVSETYYPGRWANNSYMYSSGIHFYTDQELAAVPAFSFKRSNINSGNPNAETNLHKLLVQADGTAIPDDAEVIVGYEITSLKEELNNYKNWEYENTGVGLFDIPKWDEISLLLSDTDDITAYQDANYQVGVYVERANVLAVSISDPQYNSYNICNTDVTDKYGEIMRKANTWYYYDDTTTEETIVDTPKIKLNQQYVQNQKAFDAVYGEKIVTLSQKIDQIEQIAKSNNGLLKDQIYDIVPEEVAIANFTNGDNLTLKDNYDYGTVAEAVEYAIYGPEATQQIGSIIWTNNNQVLTLVSNYNQGTTYQLFQYVDISSNDLTEAITAMSSIAGSQGIEYGRWYSANMYLNPTPIDQYDLPVFNIDDISDFASHLRPFPLSTYGTEFNLLYEEPADWTDNYFDYYEYIETDEYKGYVHIDAEEAPTFEQDTYYSRSNFDLHKPEYEPRRFAYASYTALTDEPDDWETNWLSYFIYDSESRQYLPTVALVHNSGIGSNPSLPPSFISGEVYEVEYTTINEISTPDGWDTDWPDLYDYNISNVILQNILFAYKLKEQKLSETPLSDKLYGKGIGQVSCYYLNSTPSGWQMSTSRNTVTVYQYGSVTITYTSWDSRSDCYYTFTDTAAGINTSCGYYDSGWTNSVLSIPLYEEGIEYDPMFRNITHTGTGLGETMITVAEKVADIKNWEYEKVNIQTEYEYDLPIEYSGISNMTEKVVYQQTGYTPVVPSNGGGQVEPEPGMLVGNSIGPQLSTLDAGSGSESGVKGGDSMEYQDNQGPSTVNISELNTPIAAMQISVKEVAPNPNNISYTIKVIQVIDSNDTIYWNMGQNGWIIVDSSDINNSAFIINDNDEPVALPIVLLDETGIRDYEELQEILNIQKKTVETQVNSLYYQLVTENIPAPTAPNTSGRLIIVLYNDDELVETKYDGYLYFFVDGNLSFYEAMLAANTASSGSGSGSSGGGVSRI